MPVISHIGEMVSSCDTGEDIVAGFCEGVNEVERKRSALSWSPRAPYQDKLGARRRWMESQHKALVVFVGLDSLKGCTWKAKSLAKQVWRGNGR
jgi:hypothetical protein